MGRCHGLLVIMVEVVMVGKVLGITGGGHGDGRGGDKDGGGNSKGDGCCTLW